MTAVPAARPAAGGEMARRREPPARRQTPVSKGSSATETRVADLIAQGPDPQQRWRRPLGVGEEFVVGRGTGAWSAEWDDRISRRHAALRWDGRQLHVARLAEARNPLFVAGRDERQFAIAPGEHFVIGATTFTLTSERVTITSDLPRPSQEQAFAAHYLRRHQFHHAEARLEVLTRLPEALATAAGEADADVRLVNLLLSGIPRAEAVALVAAEGAETPAAAPLAPIRVLHWDRRHLGGEDFCPSRGLILEALTRGESVLHRWDRGAAAAQFTAREDFDWAFCTPVGGRASARWGIYVAGKFAGADSGGLTDPTDLRDDLKFTELAAGMLRSLRDLRRLERERASLSQFFAPVVMSALAHEDPDEVLAPRLTDVTVMFCDLRGFSRQSERWAGDLLSLLSRVSQSLGVTTRQIRQQGGVLGDFHGDATMGFWGWPLAQPDAALRAARAALAIGREFRAAAEMAGNPLADFQVGIGLASGRAVAGKIGTSEQVKVTVFGPVVNLAARLEGMTRTLVGSVLLDDATAAAIRGALPPVEGRLRRVARISPFGMDTPVLVWELLPPVDERPGLGAELVTAYEQALDDLLAGRWRQAAAACGALAPIDPAARFLLAWLAEHGPDPPAEFAGVIPWPHK